MNGEHLGSRKLANIYDIVFHFYFYAVSYCIIIILEIAIEWHCTDKPTNSSFKVIVYNIMHGVLD